MKAFIILALAAVASGSMLPTLVRTKNGIATYNKKLTMVSDTSIYDRAWDSEPENFILNGTDAQPGQFPHVARVTIVRPTGTGRIHTFVL